MRYRTRRRVAWTPAAVLIGAIGASIAAGPPASGQVPGLPAPGGSATGGAATKAEPAAKAKAVIASTGTIAVEEKVEDPVLERTLAKLLGQYPGVRTVRVSVENGVVTIDGRVDDDDSHDEVTDFTRRVEGVRLVLNRLVTDDEVMNAPELAWRELGRIGQFFARKWLLILIAVGVLLAATTLARLFGRCSETLLAPFVSNAILRSVVGSILGGSLALGGLILALSILNLTHVVVSIVGLAGVVGLAVGFAFKDITENFIASVLLGVRRPFRVGDSLRVAGQSGSVLSLNTRATVLVTPEGDHVRIPNAVMFKEILVNSSASPGVRKGFDVTVPYEASTAEAQEAIAGALRSQDGILADPEPRATVEALEAGGVRLRATFWMPTTGVDGDGLVGDAKLKVKVALQRAGLLPGSPPAAAPAPGADGPAPAPAQAPADRAGENLRRDTRAAAMTAPVTGHDRASDVEHVLRSGDSRVGDEGANLLEGRPVGANGSSG